MRHRPHTPVVHAQISFGSCDRKVPTPNGRGLETECPHLEDEERVSPARRTRADSCQKGVPFRQWEACRGSWTVRGEIDEAEYMRLLEVIREESTRRLT